MKIRKNDNPLRKRAWNTTDKCLFMEDSIEMTNILMYTMLSTFLVIGKILIKKYLKA